MGKQMAFFEWARELKTWDGFQWPEWVPKKVRAEIESFYRQEGPRGWIERCEDVYNNLPAFGEEVCMKDSDSGPYVEGRWVSCWGNMGRIVKPDGTYVVSSTCWFKREFWASDDEEFFSVGPFQTREEAIAKAPHAAGGSFERGARFWVGQAKPVEIRNVLDSLEVIERLQEKAGEEVGEPAEGWLEDVTNAQHQSLDELLDAAVRDWLRLNKLERKFFHVIQVTEHEHACESRKDCEAACREKVGA